MEQPKPFFPQALFGAAPSTGQPVPRVLISPQRYVQGPGVIDRLGAYLALLPSRKPSLLISAGGERRFGARLKASLATGGAETSIEIFTGECSYAEVNRAAEMIKARSPQVDAIIAVGGGKCLDAGKCVAFRLGVPVVICPTIASTDAPCSAVSVMYSDAGVQVGPEFFPSSPALVVVDTQVIAEAPPRQLVAGMGDALATYFEARTCAQNPAARCMLGGRITSAALAIARLAAETVLEQGPAAFEAVKARTVREALELVVEANTLLSGVGFESGGLAAAHAIAAGLTVIPVLHRDYLHGELVGMGLLAQLLLEKQTDEAERVARFLAQVGLPVHAGQLTLNVIADAALLRSAMQAALESHLADSEPFALTPEMLLAAFLDAHQLGLATAQRVGETAFHELHPRA